MIEREEVDGVAVVRLAHGKVNALDLELVEAVTGVFRELAGDGSRAVVLTGAGRSFSAGVDLKRIVDGGADYVRAFVPALAAAFEAAFVLPKPLVAAVNGHAIAGGCVLAACADHRVMAAGNGRIGVPELLVGVPFPLAALEVMAFALGPVGARRAILGAQPLDPPAALAAGLVDEVTDAEALHEGALRTADRLAATVPADTFAHTKAALRRGVTDRLATAGPGADTEVVRLWQERVADGWIAGYLERVTRRG
jgi:enoyl-CoA hydratase